MAQLFRGIIVKEIEMSKKNYFPSNSSLEEGIVNALMTLGGKASVTDITNTLIEQMKLPKEIVELEDENDMGTKLNYRLRWCRTNLKSKGIINNIERGIWELKSK